MGYQSTFQRYELKFILNRQQKAGILAAMGAHMQLDAYGRNTIRNIYFDTEDFRLIRHSIEKPVYKEKLRLRSYGQPAPEDKIFVELKKKYQSVVYKRRLALPQAVAMDCFLGGKPLPVQSQIGNEIDYFRRYYRTLGPAVFLSYEREAYFALDGSDFRVTLDENILYRTDHLTLGGGIYGTALLAPGQTLMEVKTSGGIPLWMTKTLTDLGIQKTSFSKYGSAYQDLMAERHTGGKRYA